jgi:hypothetical protein
MASRAAPGLATTNCSAPPPFSAAVIESSAAGLSLLLAMGTSALRAITSRGVHNASARRATGSATDPLAPKMICSMPADGASVRA